MVKVLADKSLAFDNGEKDKNGRLVQVVTKIGFNELPDWVEDHDYFKMAVAEGSLKPFRDTSQSEDVLKEMEQKQALLAEIKALEEKRDMLASADVEKQKRGRKSKADGTTEEEVEPLIPEEQK